MSFLTKIKKRDMKKLLFLIIPLIIIVGYACEDRYIDPVVPPEIITHTYTASAGVGGTIKPLSGKAAYGTTVPFTVTEDVGHEVDSFFVNGVLTKLTDLSYKLKVEDSDYTLNVIFKRSMQGILMQHTWGDAHLYKRDVGTTEWIPAETHAYIYTFNEKNYNKFLDGIKIGDSPYMFKGDSLIMGPNPLGNDGIRAKITTLNDETWDYTVLSKYYQGPGDPPHSDVEYREIYKAIK